MNYPLFFAILSPVIWGTMNILDKYVIANKVKRALGYAVVAGIVNLFLGIVLALFIDWSGMTAKDLLFPAIAGILLGLQLCFYFLILQKEDVSNLIGLIYTYPILIALLSYLFLNELLSLTAYIGIAITLAGTVVLSVRIRKVGLLVGSWIAIMVLLVAFYEFFVKVATINIPEMNGIAVNIIFTGLTVMPLLLNRKTRNGFLSELKNIKWALLNESLTFSAVFVTYFAMAGLSATIVATIGTLQPIIVVFLERIVNFFTGNMTKEKLLPKLLPIGMIVIGVILLYVSELM